MIGRTYLERGHPVVVLVRWGPGGGPRANSRAARSFSLRLWPGIEKVKRGGYMTYIGLGLLDDDEEGPE